MPLDQPHKPTFMHQFCNSFVQRGAHLWRQDGQDGQRVAALPCYDKS
jgi:hypothetical protein